MTRPHITDRRRRNRLLRRHHLAADHRGTDVVTVADDMVGLHATTPSTVYLSAWARLADGFTPADLDAALYTDRTLVKQLAMRRTLFVVPRPLLRDAVGAIGSRVVASERTNLRRHLRDGEGFGDPDEWIDAARTAVAGVLDGGDFLTSAEIRSQLTEFDRSVIVSPGKSYGGPSPMLPRILNLMSAGGEIVRATNDAEWHRSRPRWSSMTGWLGEPLAPTDPAVAHVDLIRRWLATFGPGTETDLVWWLGSTKTAVRKALSEIETVEVDLDDGSVGLVLADDVDTPDDADVAPQALVLPELDPTTMGHKIRDFYLGAHTGHVFDSNGNGGQTIWWDGRIVGGWYRTDTGSGESGIGTQLFENLPASARRAVDARVAELREWLGEVRFTPGFPPPFMQALRSRS
ncbi:winged helix DNA-binding domain-containing protein [Gordonia desulfuricans]|uniref:Winged helix DNA-binding domain-containing protein n=1 Tax=Gordonia desulfuricans TaxID=89051 RepID=A0A7K3LMF8_9ACTN|nr:MULTISPECIES: winged helix DNA-binding domain-containing protein [Gordonia]EMP12978.1 hypothetical protein ISGA_1026 [Gordonia sp. NB41Y]NDK89241.1 winged helix DNA-binding domain-containing protein [Gordonia desulfuricans]WLP89358.1 winged helix DNA-binding domain-containing protein [Gordonia sp. NB41Y]